MAICMGVLIAMCVILFVNKVEFRRNEVAVGTTNPFARGRNKMDDDDDDDDDEDIIHMCNKQLS